MSVGGELQHLDYLTENELMGDGVLHPPHRLHRCHLPAATQARQADREVPDGRSARGRVVREGQGDAGLGDSVS